MSYAELGRWLENFATSHARREHPGIVVHVDMEDTREERSFGLRFALGGRAYPAADAPPLELDAKEVAEGRTRFAWCEALGQRIRADVRRYLLEERDSARAG